MSSSIGQSFNQDSSGDATSNQGAPNTAGNGWPIKLTDGTNTTAVKAASTAPVATDPAAVVTLSPNGNQATAALQTSGNSSLTSIATTSNSTATNTNAVMLNQTNGTQKTLITDVVGALFRVTSIDSTNSSSTTLGANGVFTGTMFDAFNYSTLSVLVFTDQVSATNGLVIQYSTDGTNIDDNDQYTIPASNGQQFSFPLAARYYRVVYTNGAVAQGAFRIQAKVHSTPIKSSSVRASDTVAGDSDTEINKVINMGVRPDLVIDNIKMTQSGEMLVSTRVALTPSSPTATSVGVTSASALATNANRKGLVMTNTSTAKISLNIVGGTAVLNSGITLYPGGNWYMDEFTFTTSAIFAIASAASSNLAIQELT